MNKGDELWPMLAMALLVSLLCETLMTWRMVRHQGRASVRDASALAATMARLTTASIVLGLRPNRSARSA